MGAQAVGLGKEAHMTDYEIITIMLMVLGLVIMRNGNTGK